MLTYFRQFLQILILSRLQRLDKKCVKNGSHYTMTLIRTTVVCGDTWIDTWYSDCDFKYSSASGYER